MGTAGQSEIKGTPYSPDSVLALLEGFRGQATRALLFLKRVRQVAVYAQAAGEASPSLLFRASLDTQVAALPTCKPCSPTQMRWECCNGHCKPGTAW